jgi:hypothetical protein
MQRHGELALFLVQIISAHQFGELLRAVAFLTNQRRLESLSNRDHEGAFYLSSVQNILEVSAELFLEADTRWKKKNT